MSIPEDHLDKAIHNEAVIITLLELDNKPYDWLVTISFYSALHYVNAFLALKGDLHPTDHHSTLQFLNPKGTHNLGFDETCYNYYKGLQNRSRQARYMVYSSVDRKSTHKFISYKRFEESKNFLEKIKKFVLSELSIRTIGHEAE